MKRHFKEEESSKESESWSEETIAINNGFRSVLSARVSVDGITNSILLINEKET